MSYKVSIIVDLNRHSRSLNAYDLSLFESDEERYSLRQNGPVFNNKMYRSGVFAKREEAIRAMLDYIGEHCKVLERTDLLGGGSSVVVRPLSDTPTPREPGMRVRVLGTRSPLGNFIANEDSP